jgi:urease accessory protein UreE
MSKLLLAIVAALVFGSTAVVPAEATTTFVRSTVEGIDLAKQTITFQARDGQTWTLRVENPELLKKDSLAKGDQVTIEVNPNDEVKTILKLSQPNEPDRAESK